MKNASKVVWTYRHPEQRLFPYYSSAAVSQGGVGIGGRDEMVHALDAKSGKAHWDVHRQTRRCECQYPAVVGTRVFVGSTDGRLYELDLMKGAKLSDFDAGATIGASPSVANGRVIFSYQDGRLYCLG